MRHWKVCVKLIVTRPILNSSNNTEGLNGYRIVFEHYQQLRVPDVSGLVLRTGGMTFLMNQKDETKWGAAKWPSTKNTQLGNAR